LAAEISVKILLAQGYR